MASESPADSGQRESVRDAEEREVVRHRIDNLERRVAALSASLERLAAEDAKWPAKEPAASGYQSIQLADLIARLERVEGRVDGSQHAASEIPSEFGEYLDATETHIERGALASAAELVFGRLGLDPKARSFVTGVSQAFFRQRIADLRTINDAAGRPGGGADTAPSYAELKAADEHLLEDLRSQLTEAQALALLPMIQRVVKLPAYLPSHEEQQVQ